LIAILVAEIYLLKLSLTASEQFQDINSALTADPDNPPAYVDFEELLAQKFNRFFFGAGSECKSRLISFALLCFALQYSFYDFFQRPYTIGSGVGLREIAQLQ
jgi:hypothetical protein